MTLLLSHDLKGSSSNVGHLPLQFAVLILMPSTRGGNLLRQVMNPVFLAVSTVVHRLILA